MATHTDPGRFGAAIREWATRETRAIALDAYREFMGRAAVRAVDLSPVRTGHFVRNWRVVQGRHATTEMAGADPGKSATKARLLAEVDALQFGRPASLMNATPYSQRLENGWSRQAPRGILRVIASELRHLFQAVRGNRSARARIMGRDAGGRFL